MQQLFWLLKADGVYMYLHQLNRKYVVNSNAVSNVKSMTDVLYRFFLMRWKLNDKE